MSKVKVSINHLPVVKEYEITASELSKLISSQPIQWRDIDLDDAYYFYTDWDGWRKMIDYILPSLPKYIPEKFDCDNMSKWFSSEVNRLFSLNTCAMVEGWADMGDGYVQRHKWCIFYDGVCLYQLEPQTGVVMDIDDTKYIPDEIVIG